MARWHRVIKLIGIIKSPRQLQLAEGTGELDTVNVFTALARCCVDTIASPPLRAFSASHYRYARQSNQQPANDWSNFLSALRLVRGRAAGKWRLCRRRKEAPPTGVSAVSGLKAADNTVSNPITSWVVWRTGQIELLTKQRVFFPLEGFRRRLLSKTLTSGT